MFPNRYFPKGSFLNAPPTSSVEVSLKYILEGALGIDMYPVRLPQNAPLPAITYRLISPDWKYTLNRDVPSAGRSLYQFSIFSRSYAQAKQLSNQIRQTVQTYRGSANGVSIGSIVNTDERDLVEAPKDGSDRPIYHVATSYRVLYQ